MKIHQLFLKDVSRPIDGVIKADDDRHLDLEVDEFVVTREVGRALDQFVERYLEDTSANGVWISGFFGSGKSHLLKILSLLLDQRPLPSGRKPADVILPHIEDEILRGSMERAVQIPSHSILFNIDQKADHIGGDTAAPILEVFVKVLNELRGYHGKQGHIAKLEYDLDKAGQLAAFKQTYLEVNSREWEKDRDALATARRKAFNAAYAKHFAVSEEDAVNVLNQIRDEYRVSIESFAEQVREYIDQQGKDFRLNFFVDEVGQFIGQDSKLMLNLQTVAESLATKCDGRSWVFVTSQGDLQKVLGDLKKEQGDDFTKIQGRFKTRPNLTSADVREVIQRRLLAKMESEPEALTKIFDEEKENLQTLFRFSDDSVQYKGWRGSDEFCDLYPFHPYQFDLFQRAIEQLSKHDAFTGKHTSVGERSMLEVFQSVAKSLKNEEVGSLATFDRMFDGITATLRGDMQTSILQAANHLDDPLALKILKALFLLKWVREFKATPRNVAILLIDRANMEDIAAHEKAVKQSLVLLAAQSYLQQNGEVFEFLTDSEKDVEVEIKGTEIDDSQVTKLLSEVLFDDVVKSPKIRFEGNGQDYTYARKLDDHLVGKDAELTLNIITPDHPNHGDERSLAAQGTGKSELILVLASDYHLMEEARLYLKTEKYAQQNTGTNTDPSRKVILDERRKQNGVRRSNLQSLCSELFVKASIYLNGSKIEGSYYSEPKTRFHKMAQDLVTFAFPNLRMLKGSYDENLLRKTLLDPDDLLTGGQQPLSESEQEIMTYVQRNQDQGERTSVEEMIRQFGRRPYGWYPLAVQTLIGRLFRMGKIELRAPATLDGKAALEHLVNTRLHGTVRVRLQEQFDSTKINALKRFHQDFFDRTNDGTDARSVGQSTLTQLAVESRLLKDLLLQADRYPFLESLRSVEDQIAKLADRDYTHLLNHLTDFDDSLLNAKEDILDPIKVFMNGPQKVAYDEAIAFLREEEANFNDLTPEDVQPLRDLAQAATPYRGNSVPLAKAAVTKLRIAIAGLLDQERQNAEAVLTDHEQRLAALPDCGKLDDSAKTKVLAKSTDARAAIATARFVTAIRDRVNRYRSIDYPTQLELAATLATPAPVPGGGNSTPTPPAPTYVPATSLRTKCKLPFLSNEAEIDEWLAALRESAVTEIQQGKRLSL
ncbi:MAG: BREX system P-loop protein BrxC [Akkermansiaceae bacterium]